MTQYNEAEELALDARIERDQWRRDNDPRNPENQVDEDEEEPWESTTDPIDNSEDILNSEDIQNRIDDLEEGAASGDLDDDETEELVRLKEFRDELGLPDWTYGETLIRESYFEEYAEQLAEDIGAISRDASWPLTHIDWTEAAEVLKIDYTSADLDGVTYWGR